MTRPRAFGLESLFVDSSGYYSLADTAERRHRDAVAALHRAAVEPWRALTTNFVRAEAHALILNRLGRPAAMRFLHGLAAGTTTLERVSPADEARALTIIEQFQDKTFSLTDATSFAVMERLGITHAFHFDEDFRQYGRFVDFAAQLRS